ncbi:MAG: GTPase [Christensenellaceae bacterium]|jgi:hypothetical protein|nr:GTPase [Christensenellaceae bacterium]
MEIPVYLFTGFLEAGKTRFIQETLSDARFNEGERTLLLVCEQGEEEYDPAAFADASVHLKTIERIEDLTAQKLLGYQKQYHIQRVVLEYNGMWPMERLFSALPQGWVLYQDFFFADAATFLQYNVNLRSLVVDKLQSCELAVFNRADASTDKALLHKIVRGLNRRCAIAYEYPDGKVEYDEIEDPLPFDINAPVIEVEDDDFALWYRDITEEMDQYVGKVVRFTGTVAVSGRLPTGCFLAGRHVMTCCAEDISYAALCCEWDPEMIRSNLKKRDWVTVTARIAVKYHRIYGKKGPVLTVVTVQPAAAPAKEVATFY